MPGLGFTIEGFGYRAWGSGFRFGVGLPHSQLQNNNQHVTMGSSTESRPPAGIGSSSSQGF